METKSPLKRKPHARRPKQPGLAPTQPFLRAKLVRIGNSRGVRLPKAVIEQAGLGENVEISVTRHGVTIRPANAKHPRAGWDEQIKKALAEQGDDIDDWRDWQNMPNKFDEKEWTW